MKQQKTKQLVEAGLFAALCCVATLIIQVPMPGTGGYVNLGDCFVLTAGWLLGPFYGTAAAGIGSILADLLSGYGYYAPGTLVIKALMALAAWGCANALAKRIGTGAARAVSAAAGEAIMVGGYFLYAWLLLGRGAAAAVTSIPGNLIQGAFGLVTSLVLTTVLVRVRGAQQIGTSGEN